MIRLVATDLDDTLLLPDGSVGAYTRCVFGALQRQGVRIALVSGRMPAAMRFAAQALGGGCALIGYNGAATVDTQTGSTLSRFPVPLSLAREAAAFAHRRGFHVQAYQGDSYVYAQENAWSRAYAASIGLAGSAVGMPVDSYLSADPDKLLIIGPPEKIACLCPQMQAHFGERLHCAISRPRYIEVFRRGIDKAVALSALCKGYGIGPEETIAFGDGENDLPMLAFAGVSYAMANAGEAVQRAVGRIAPDNAQEGVAQVLKQLFSLQISYTRQEER